MVGFGVEYSIIRTSAFKILTSLFPSICLARCLHDSYTLPPLNWNLGASVVDGLLLPQAADARRHPTMFFRLLTGLTISLTLALASLAQAPDTTAPSQE